MRLLISTLVFMFVLLIVFLVGVGGQSPALTLPAFCLWTPAAWMVGYAFAKSGLRFRAPVQQTADSIHSRQFSSASTRTTP